MKSVLTADAILCASCVCVCNLKQSQTTSTVNVAFCRMYVRYKRRLCQHISYILKNLHERGYTARARDLRWLQPRADVESPQHFASRETHLYHGLPALPHSQIGGGSQEASKTGYIVMSQHWVRLPEFMNIPHEHPADMLRQGIYTCSATSIKLLTCLDA
jgi:hypothetical protein